MDSLPWFIKNSEGRFYTGGEGDRATFIEGRKGAIVFPSKGSAQRKIDEFGLEGCEPSEF